MSDWKVITGDCLEVLKTIPAGSVDAVVMDAPYGIQHQSNGQIFLNAHRCQSDGNLDAMEWVCDWARSLPSPLPMVCFFSPYKPPRIEWRSILVWNKGAHVGGGGDIETCWKRDHELIGVRNNGPLGGGRDSSVLHFNAVSPPPSGHFCEKPVELMRYLIEKVVPIGGTVLDPFAGSGATGVAAMQCGRNFLGIEIEERWADIARRRIGEAASTLWTPLKEPEPDQELFAGDTLRAR